MCVYVVGEPGKVRKSLGVSASRGPMSDTLSFKDKKLRMFPSEGERNGRALLLSLPHTVIEAGKGWTKS